MKKYWYLPVIFIAGLLIGASWINASAERSVQTAPAAMQSPPEISSNSPQTRLPLEFTVNQLHEALKEEIEQRKKLSQELSELKQQIASLSGEDFNTAETAHNAAQVSINSLSNSDGERVDDSRQPEEILTALGLDNQAIQRLNNRREKLEMDELYLRNQAIREGWFRTERYVKERRKLSSTDIYREELGDALYDQYLYDSGQFNRVDVQSVLAGSPAEKTGIMEGDIVYSYDGKRIYRWTDLTSATSEGEPDQTVNVQLLRNGQFVDVYMPRGPMGIRLSSSRVDPAG